MRTLKIAAVMVLLVTSIAAADPIVQTVYVGADAYTRSWSSYADSNYSAGSTVNISTSTANTEEGYLRFDVTGLIPAGHEATSAILRIYWDNLTTLDVGLFGLADGAAGDAAPGSGGWIENEITYNNAPTASTSLGTYAKTAYGSQYMESAAIVDFLNADTNGLVTFKLNTTYGSTIGFNSKEAGGSGSAYLYFTTDEIVLMDGDANRDGIVSAGDYVFIQANFGHTGVRGIPGDANGDGVVSIGDYASVHANFGDVTPVTAMPEPGTMSLLAISGIAFLRRRRK